MKKATAIIHVIIHRLDFILNGFNFGAISRAFVLLFLLILM